MNIETGLPNINSLNKTGMQIMQMALWWYIQKQNEQILLGLELDELWKMRSNAKSYVIL